MNNGIFPDDKEIIKAIQAKGAAAQKEVDALYTKYRDVVLKKLQMTIRFRRGQLEDARDLLHDGFSVMIEKIPSDSYVEGSLPNFWYGICIGLFKNKWKRDQRMTLTGDVTQIDKVDDYDPSRKMEEEQRRQILSDLLQQLGEKCVKIMELSFAGYSMKEIAVKMELASDGMARKIKYHCKKNLIELVKDLDFEF